MNNDLGKIVLIVLAGGVLIYLISSYNKKQDVNVSGEIVDNFESYISSEVDASETLGQNEIYKGVDEPRKADDPFNLKNNQYPKDCFPKDQLSPSELLPGDANSKWAQVNPSGQGELGDQNFLSAGYHVGVNTVGQSLRNANMQLRSDPPNPQLKVSPWMQTTIEPDTNRKPLEIGGC